MSAALLLASGVAAGDESEDAPDAAFLEYLGMWDGESDEWELFEEQQDTESNGERIDALNDVRERDDAAPPGDTSTENNDEG